MKNLSLLLEVTVCFQKEGFVLNSCAQPSFGSGLAKRLDSFGRFDEYNESRLEIEADERAIASDWVIIGQDMSDAFELYIRSERSKGFFVSFDYTDDSLK